MDLVPVRNRIVFLDWLRGVAAIVMLQGHTFDSFLRPELRDQPAYIFSQFFGGQAAAIFLFLTGITFGLGMNKRDGLPAWQRITGSLRRARYLVLIAIAFRIQMWIFGQPYQSWTDLLRVDVLNVMGATAALLSVIALAQGMQRVKWALLAGIALAALAPVMSGLNTNGIPAAVRDYFVPGTAFSMFPWGSYLAFGLAAGSGMHFVKRSDWPRVMPWAALCGFGLLLAGQYFSNLPFSLYSNANFWVDSPALVACKMGITLLLGSVAFLWTEYFSQGYSWVRLLGTTSLAVYWVHVELLYGRWLWTLKQHLTVWECLAASMAMVLAMAGMSAAIRYFRPAREHREADDKRAAA